MQPYQLESARKLAAIRARLGPDVTPEEMDALCEYFNNPSWRQHEPNQVRLASALLETHQSNPARAGRVRQEAGSR